MPPWALSGHGIDPLLTPVHRKVGGAHIFLRSIGTVYENYTSSAQPLTTISQPPDVVAGDLLVVFGTVMSGNPGSPEEGTTWTLLHSMTGSQLRAWSRVATADANDLFRISATLGPHPRNVKRIQMIALGSLSGTIALEGKSAERSAADANSYILESVPVFVEANNTFVLQMFHRTAEAAGTALPATFYTPASEIIGSHAQSLVIGNTQYVWWGWSWKFQEVSAVVPLLDMPFTPSPTVSSPTVRTISFRYKSV